MIIKSIRPWVSKDVKKAAELNTPIIRKKIPKYCGGIFKASKNLKISVTKRVNRAIPKYPRFINPSLRKPLFALVKGLPPYVNPMRLDGCNVCG